MNGAAKGACALAFAAASGLPRTGGQYMARTERKEGARMTPPVGIIMGSQSDWATMNEAALILDQLGVAYETKIVSAHRTPTGCGTMARPPWGGGCR